MLMKYVQGGRAGEQIRQFDFMHWGSDGADTYRIRYKTVRYSTIRYSTVRYSTIRKKGVRYKTVQCYKNWYVVLNGILLNDTATKRYM